MRTARAHGVVHPVPSSVAAPVKALLEEVRARHGHLPGLVRLLAHSPAALGGHLAFDRALANSVLPAAMRERIAIAVAASNACGPCLAVPKRRGREEAGLPEAELAAAREGASGERAARAALRFARALLAAADCVPDEALEAVRGASFGDAAVVEIAASFFLNGFNSCVTGLARVEMGNPEGVDGPSAASTESGVRAAPDETT